LSKEWRDLLGPVPRDRVETRAAAAKWVAGVCGIGFTLAWTSVISSYAVFQADPGKCMAQLAAADGMNAARKLALLFGIGAVSALTAVGLPAWRRQRYRPIPSIGAVAGGKTDGPDWTPSGLLADIQLLGIAGGVVAFCLAIVLSWAVTGDMAGSGLQRFGDAFRTQCDARPGPTRP
jgi:hypothetical protein